MDISQWIEHAGTHAVLATGGAVVGLGVAYKLGAAEADEFRRALVLTGNAAGASMGELQAAAAGARSSSRRSRP
jgi:phage-related minor tail protein